MKDAEGLSYEEFSRRFRHARCEVTDWAKSQVRDGTSVAVPVSMHKTLCVAQDIELPFGVRREALAFAMATLKEAPSAVEYFPLEEFIRATLRYVNEKATAAGEELSVDQTERLTALCQDAKTPDIVRAAAAVALLSNLVPGVAK